MKLSTLEIGCESEVLFFTSNEAFFHNCTDKEAGNSIIKIVKHSLKGASFYFLKLDFKKKFTT